MDATDTLIELARNHPYLDFVFTAYQTYRVEAEVVAEVDDRVVGIGNGGYRNQYYLVPIDTFVALAVAIGNEACDVAVLVTVVGAVISGVE